MSIVQRWALLLVVCASSSPAFGQTCQLSTTLNNPLTLTSIGTSTAGFYPSVVQTIHLSAMGCPAGAGYVIASDHPEWLVPVATPTGDATGLFVNYVAFSNAQSSARTARLTITPIGQASVPLVLAVTESADPEPLLVRQITAMYQRLLNREADYPGFLFWTGSGAAYLTLMVDSFLTSPESQSTDFMVLAIYQAALGHPPTFTEYQAAITAITQGQKTPEEILASLGTPSTSDTAYVNAVYVSLLGRAPSAAEAIPARVNSPFQVLSAILAGDEFRNQGVYRTGPDHSNGLFIRMLYYTIFFRDVDAAGFDFWLGVANSGGPGIYFNSPDTRQVIEGAPVGVACACQFQGGGFLGSVEFSSLFQ